MDKAGQQYWTDLWRDSVIPSPVDPRRGGLNNFVNRQFHAYFAETIARFGLKGKRLLEIGCARSAWLPYFAREFNMDVSGVDYSSVGCEQAKSILNAAQITGAVLCHDFFNPPSEALGAYDLLVSFGVVEHFENTGDCVAAHARYLKPGGVMITNIPNMRGLTGWLQRLHNKPVFDVHVPLSPAALGQAHAQSGLQVVSVDYFMLLNLGVVNCENLRGTVRYAVSGRLRSWISKMVWTLDPVLSSSWRNVLTSPYINCLAVKPNA